MHNLIRHLIMLNKMPKNARTTSKAIYKKKLLEKQINCKREI